MSTDIIAREEDARKYGTSFNELEQEFFRNEEAIAAAENLAEFVGAGTKALVRIARVIGVELAANWAENPWILEDVLLETLMSSTERLVSPVSTDGVSFDSSDSIETATLRNLWKMADSETE